MSLALLLAAAAVAVEPPPPPPQSVDAVEITTRAPVVGDLQKGVLNYRAEFFTQVRPATAMDMVVWLPGFIFEDTRELRGLGGAGGNVLIDGKPPTSKTDTLQSVLRRIPSSQVDRIDIIVGGAPGVDMQGRPVIANVILKVTATRRRVVQLQTYADKRGRSSPQLLLSTSEKRGDRSLEGSLEVGQDRAFGLGRGYGSWTRRDGAGAILADGELDSRISAFPWVNTSAAYETPFAAGRLRVNALGRYMRFRFEETADLRVPAGPSFFRGEQTYHQGEFGLRYERTRGRWLLQTQLLYRFSGRETNEHNERLPPPIFFHEEATDNETVGRLTARFKRDDRLTVEAFAEGALNGVRTASYGTVGGAARDVPSASVNVSEQRGETGATVSWKPNTRLSLDTALKLEGSALTSRGGAVLSRDFAYLKPRLALNWSPNKDAQVRLRVEHEVGQINFLNFATLTDSVTGRFRTGNPNLLPQRTWIAEAVAERRFWSGGSLSVTLRRRALKDVVETLALITPTETAVIVANVGDARSTDLIVNLTVPMKRLGLNGVIARAVVTRNWPRITDPTTGVVRAFNGQPTTQAELHLNQDLPAWKLNWGIDAFYRGGSKVYYPVQDDTIAPWPHVNLFVERRLRPTLTLRAEVQNLPAVRVSQTLRVFTGLRDRSPLQFTDERRLSFGPILFVRLRKTFE